MTEYLLVTHCYLLFVIDCSSSLFGFQILILEYLADS